MREKVKWAAIARLANESGFWGVLVIRYSIVPPRKSPQLRADLWSMEQEKGKRS